jgi:uncharacterized protein YebE (UPF0316 family)
VDAIFASPVYGPLVIFAARIVDVSLDTLRVLFAIRGRRIISGTLGFFQAIVFIVAVGSAIAHLDSVMHVLGYASGFAAGTVVGITIERALAYGLSTVRVVSRHGGVEIAEALRERGYGVTEFGAFGKEGRVEFLHSVVHRSHLDEVLKIVDSHDPDAFVTVEEPQVLRGGRFATNEWLVPKEMLKRAIPGSSKPKPNS